MISIEKKIFKIKKQVKKFLKSIMEKADLRNHFKKAYYLV